MAGDGRHAHAAMRSQRALIYDNHRLMSDGANGPTHVAAVGHCYRRAERIGDGLGLRELLMLVAYRLTGGYRCTDVHRRSGRRDWRRELRFTQNLFGERLTPSQRGSLRSLVTSALLTRVPFAANHRRRAHT